MKAYEVLEGALAHIENEENWCTGVMQRGNDQRCALGAIRLVGMEKGLMTWSAFEGARASEPLRSAQRALGTLALQGLGLNLDPSFYTLDPIAAFNDTHTHAEVVALFQEAIREEKHREGVRIEMGQRLALIETEERRLGIAEEQTGLVPKPSLEPEPVAA